MDEKWIPMSDGEVNLSPEGQRRLEQDVKRRIEREVNDQLPPNTVGDCLETAVIAYRQHANVGHRSQALKWGKLITAIVALGPDVVT